MPASSLRPLSPPGRLLVVDDDEKNRWLLKDALEVWGCRVEEAENGEQALARVRASPPDVVLLDVMMPGIDGFEVCRRLKADPASARIPVLMVTALTDRRERLLAVEAGASDFLSKPVDLHEVAVRVRNALEAKRLVDELAAAGEQLEARNRELEATNARLREAISTAEAARQAADQASRYKSDFLAKMSHELRTPLNAILGYDEMLQETVETLHQPELLPDLSRIHAAARHLLAVINDILDLSRIEAGRMTFHVELFDVAKLVSEVASTVEPLMARNRDTLKIECPADAGSMSADSTKVRQILFNLLSNAAKFTENGRVTLRVKPDTARFEFEVADTGIGMTAEQAGRLFEDFRQADTAITAKYGGSGLGLVVSRKFCHLMGGDMTVTSDLGKGSTFTAMIPRAVDAREIERRLGPKPAAPGH